MSNEKRVPIKEQEPLVRAKNFEEVCLGYNDSEAALEASRCLTCKNPQCVTGCPVNIDIPSFISKLKDNDIEGAYEVITLSSSLPAVCGRVCPQETQCESKCIRGLKGDAIAIGKLERYVADKAREEGIKPKRLAQSNGHKVAIIGAGPSGLTCAGDLAKLGYDVTIFEALHEAGGVLTYGIPEFRLPKDTVVRSEIENVKSLGVKIETDVVIGRSVTIDELIESEGFEAVFIGSGAGLPMFMKIPGENAKGVFSANEYLTRSNLMKAFREDYDTPIFKPKKTVVVGGGNVAMDVARSAIRCNAKSVKILYRRRISDMTALPEEVEGAIADGCEVVELHAPLRIEKNDDDKVTAIWVQPQIVGPVKDGRPKPVPADTEEVRIPCDRVLVAIGQGIDSRKFGEYGIPVERGHIDAFDTSDIRDKEGVFAGGDCVTGPATVIRAIAAGKVAAANIDEYLGYHHKIPLDAQIPVALPNPCIPTGRAELEELDPYERKSGFNPVELPMTYEEAMRESGRCLRCDHHGCGVLKGGRGDE